MASYKKVNVEVAYEIALQRILELEKENILRAALIKELQEELALIKRENNEIKE